MCDAAAPQAVIALAKQLPDRFSEFVSYVFERQAEFNAAAGDALSQGALKEVFCSMAESFGADRARFAEDISSEDVMLSVKESQRLGILHGVWSTPTYIINGTEVPSLGSSTTPEQWATYLGTLLA